jgi:hypothetical protein
MANMTFRLSTNKKHEIVIGILEVEVTYPDGRPASGAAYTLTIEGGGERKGTLDSKGKLVEKDIQPGKTATLKIAGAPVIALAE